MSRIQRPKISGAIDEIKVCIEHLERAGVPLHEALAYAFRTRFDYSYRFIGKLLDKDKETIRSYVAKVYEHLER